MKYFILIITLFPLIIKPAIANEIVQVSAPAPTVYAQIENDELAGPSIELLRLIFSSLNVSVKTVPLPWARALKNIEEGSLDAIAPIFYNDKRAMFIDFSTPFDTTETRVFKKKESNYTYNSWDDLRGAQGYIVRGRSEGNKFDTFAASFLKLDQKNDLNQIIKMLIRDRGDYGIDKYYDIIAESKKMGVYDEIKILPLTISTNDITIGLSKKSPFKKYMPQINKMIKQYKADGTFRKLMEKHINAIATVE